MAWGTDKLLMELTDLANRKGFDVLKADIPVRLTGPDGNPVKNESGGAA